MTKPSTLNPKTFTLKYEFQHFFVSLHFICILKYNE